MAPQSLLHAVFTIMVKKRLVNSILFIHFVGSGSAVVAARWQRWRRQEHNGGGQLGGGGGSLVEA